jgi:peptide/nickel transport system substrate-binding protein
MNENIAEGSPFVGSGKLDGEGIPLNFFSDVHIRRAFNYCFDYDTFIKDVQLGDAQRSLALTLPGQLGYDGSPIYEYDLAKCEEEFKAAELKMKRARACGTLASICSWGYNAGSTERRRLPKSGRESGEVNPNFFVSPVSMPGIYLRTRSGSIFTTGWFEGIHDPHNCMCRIYH